jgi:rhodanese-related sulfurtransferase
VLSHAENPTRLSVDEARARIASGERVAFVDSRNPIAWASSRVKISGAYRVPVDDVERQMPSLPHDHHLIVYCT